MVLGERMLDEKMLGEKREPGMKVCRGVSGLFAVACIHTPGHDL